MRRWLAIFALLVVGAVLGAGAIVASTVVNQLTSTEAFCTSCHSMANVAADPHYLQSAHRNNAAGVLANCADCHVRSDNWFVETYSHVVDGIRDGIAEYTSNFDDPAAWAARLPALAQQRARRNAARRQRDLPQVPRPGADSSGEPRRSVRTCNAGAGQRHLHHLPRQYRSRAASGRASLNRSALRVRRAAR